MLMVDLHGMLNICLLLNILLKLNKFLMMQIATYGGKNQVDLLEIRQWQQVYSKILKKWKIL